MLTSLKRLRVRFLIAAVVLGLSAAAADAGPPPGMRWSDHARLHGSTVTPAPNAGRSFSRSYSAPSTSSAIVRSPIRNVVPSTSSTVTVRGPDGVLRTYPMVGGTIVMQGQGAQSIVTQPQNSSAAPATVAPQAVPGSVVVPCPPTVPVR